MSFEFSCQVRYLPCAIAAQWTELTCSEETPESSMHSVAATLLPNAFELQAWQSERRGWGRGWRVACYSLLQYRWAQLAMYNHGMLGDTAFGTCCQWIMLSLSLR